MVVYSYCNPFSTIFEVSMPTFSQCFSRKTKYFGSSLFFNLCWYCREIVHFSVRNSSLLKMFWQNGVSLQNQHKLYSYCIIGWALFSKYILLISYFEDLILLILMVCFFLHITYRNLVEFSLL